MYRLYVPLICTAYIRLICTACLLLPNTCIHAQVENEFARTMETGDYLDTNNFTIYNGATEFQVPRKSVYVYACVCMYMYTYTYLHMHTYIHINTYMHIHM